jgi:hypothetical protein
MNTVTVSTKSGHWFDAIRFRICSISLLAFVMVAATATAADAYVRTGGSGRATIFGEIQDFGSIVVNGVHYDESAANIIIDGVPHQTRTQLKLGMIAQIDGTLDYSQNTGVANVVRVNRVLFGRVDAVDRSKSEVTVLNQRVVIGVKSRFDGFQDLSQLLEGDWIAVHGLEDPGRKSLVATLVERVIPEIGSSSSIRGTVQKMQAGKLRIGKLDILVYNVNVEDGDYVSITGDYLGGVFVSTDVVVTREVATVETVETQLQGYVADFRNASDFVVAGVRIDASNADFSGGRASELRQDVRITVEGSIQNGILVADEITYATDNSDDSPLTLEGRITSFASAADFVVKGQRVDASNAVLKSDLAPKAGWKAKLKGWIDSNGVLRVTKAEFERP